MTDFTDAIERNWPDYVISPGASKMECCIDSHMLPDCPACNGHGYDYDNEPHPDCPECDGDGRIPLEKLTDEQFEGMYLDEGSFSWSECDSCSSHLGGDRFSAHAIHKEAFGPDAKRPDDVHHISICVDCLMFHANGEEPEVWEG